MYGHYIMNAKRASGIYFNQFVKTEFGELKYGIISTDDIIIDLTMWRHLYVAGRLHKPVKFITPVKNISNQYDLSISRPDNDQILSPGILCSCWLAMNFSIIHLALQYNLTSALRIASLLNFNEKTSFDELIYTICNLSYTGFFPL